jgi:hypothetical protein
MPIGLQGPGVGLPIAQNLYPSLLNNAPIDPSSNQIGLSPGESMTIPAGDWYITLGMYLVLEFLDPVTNTWYIASGSAYERGMSFVASDGFTCRIANLTGCIVSASVINGGTGYVQATTTITAIGAFQSGVALPTFLPIVGGALNVSGGTLQANGAGYGIAPIVAIPPPPPAQSNANGVGGIQAAAIAIIASGTVSSISMINQGAGYPTAPIGVIIPSPFDPNLSTGITNATVAFTLASAGIIMGALVTNNGGPLVNGSLASVTLSVGGAGTSGSLTANVLQTVVSGTVSGNGTGFGTAVQISTYGGVPVAGIGNTPINEGIAFLPRQANISAPSITAGAVAAIYDGGLFEASPTFLAVGTLGASVAPTLAMIMGSRYDIAVIQPTP